MTLFVLLLAGCHCGTPLCAHDLQYMLLGIPFLLPLRLRIQNFHWWRHKKCKHHPKDQKCKNHDHAVPGLPEYCEPAATKCAQEMKNYWENERSKIS